MYISQMKTASRVLEDLIRGGEVLSVEEGAANNVSLEGLKLPVRILYTRTDGKEGHITLDDYKVALAIRKARGK